LFVVFFCEGKAKRTATILSHCFGFAKLHFHLSNFSTNVIHPNLTFFEWHPPLHPHYFDKFILIIFDNITLCSSQPNRDKEKVMKPHENKISIVEISKWGVCGTPLQVLAHNKEKQVDFPNQQPALWIATQLLHNSTSDCCKAKSLPKEWSLEQAKVLINTIK
jgi:hypothetical protein